MVLFAKHPQVNDYDLSSVNRVVCAAAPLSPEIEEAVKNKLNLKYVQQGKFGYCIYEIVSDVCFWHCHFVFIGYFSSRCNMFMSHYIFTTFFFILLLLCD